MRARAKTIRSSVRASAVAFGGLRGCARAIDRVSIGRWLRVTPETPQQLVWLVPQYGIDYDVTTSGKFDWNLE